MIAQADAVRIPLPSKSVHCAMTSPPYWGLRKYAGEQGRIWGGDPECEHEWSEKPKPRKIAPQTSLAYQGANSPQAMLKTLERLAEVQSPGPGGQWCQLCGAWYGSLGLEPTPEQHTENIVEICREVRRVLRDDGVFWLNYGDCYAGGSQTGRNDAGRPEKGRGWAEYDIPRIKVDKRQGVSQGSLMMMPHRVALALQQDGWIVRQDLVWFKRNPMPESVAGTRWVKHRIKEGRSKHAADHNIKGGTQKMLEDASVHQGINEDWVPKYIDCPGCEKCIPNDGLVLKHGSFRHTRSHEYVFQLVKGPKMYYWSDQEAVRESAEYGRKGWHDPAGTLRRAGGNPDENTDARWTGSDPSAGRNPRSVLDVPTAPYKGAHYATFPPNLIAPLIRATCPRWACPVCGQGWAAVVNQQFNQTGRDRDNTSGGESDMEGWEGIPRGINQSSVLGYRPTCEHEAPHDFSEANDNVCARCGIANWTDRAKQPCSVPGIVFDPFVGSGTTVKVAQDLLRKGIGIDISMEYLDLQAKVRIGQGSPSNVLDDLPLFQ